MIDANQTIHFVSFSLSSLTSDYNSGTLSKMSRCNKKSWVKPRKLQFGAMGFSLPGTVAMGTSSYSRTPLLWLQQNPVF